MNHPNTDVNHSDQDSTNFVSIYIYFVSLFSILSVHCLTYFTHFKKYSGNKLKEKKDDQSNFR